MKAARANVHRFPTTASAIIAGAAAGTVLEIERHLGSWVEVAWPETETGVAYVHLNAGTIRTRETASTAASSANAAAAEIAAVAERAAAAGTHDVVVGTPPRDVRTVRREATYVSLPSRRIGIGAVMHTSRRLLGATARTWWPHGIGAQLATGRPQIASADGQTIPSMLVAPSALYALPQVVTNSMWLRPYVGGGPRFHRTNQENRVGYETFGGAELTAAGAPQVAMSADLGYRWVRPAFGDFKPRRIAFSVSGHWFVK